MIYLMLFWTFFKIGLFTIGGGYSMIPMIESEVIDALGWLTREQLLDFIGVAESTPGPIALNLATFIGTSQAGFLGAVCATVGVVLPSLIIILLIAIVFEKAMKSAAVQGFFYGVRPVVVGLVGASALSLALAVVLPALDLKSFTFDAGGFDPVGLALMGACFALYFVPFGKKKKHIHPILMIAVAALAGVLLFGVMKL